MTYLCVTLFLWIISGVLTQTSDSFKNVTGYQGGDVVLQCNCTDRNKMEKFSWQTGNPLLIFKVNQTYEEYGKNYKNRVKIFVNESSNNCSILLKNITEADNNNYTCSFNNGVRKYHTVNLKVIQRPPSTSTDPPNTPSPLLSPNPARRYFTIIPVIALILLVGYLGNLYLKQRRNWGAPNQGETPISSDVGV